MNERLTALNRAMVQETMVRIEPQTSYSDKLSSQLATTVFGQGEACKAVGRRLALFDTGLGDPQRPLGSMFFLGPSGVGKTEMAKAALKTMKLQEDRLRILNMAEYQKDHYVSRFVGSPPSYVGYNEEPAIPHKWLHAGRSIIVFDEIEKAHPDIRQALLGILDHGIMDARNRQEGSQPLHFNNSLLIFTSNIAASEIHKVLHGGRGMGFNKNELSTTEKTKRVIGEAQKGLENALSPEFINRLDDIVIFNELSDPAIYDQMITKFIDQRNDCLFAQRGTDSPYFAVTSEFRQMVLSKTTGKGGRELKRLLEKELFDKAADVFMGMDVRGRPLVADFEDGNVNFYTNMVVTIEEKTNLIPFDSSKKKDIQLPISPTQTEGPRSGEGNKTRSAGGTDDGVDADEEKKGDGLGNNGPEETGDEDIKGPKARRVRFAVPNIPKYSMDLAVVIYNGDKPIMGQEIEGMPIVPFKK